MVLFPISHVQTSQPDGPFRGAQNVCFCTVSITVHYRHLRANPYYARARISYIDVGYIDPLPEADPHLNSPFQQVDRA